MFTSIMKKDKKQTPGISFHPEGEKNTGLILKVILALSFFTSFISYVMTLAPTVTFEDSGELTAAAYLLGVPHQPGYPLFTMVGHLFTYLPFGNIAYRVNLMSAFFSALGAMFITWSTIALIENTFTTRIKTGRSSLGGQPYSMTLANVCGFCAGLFAALSYENWEQSIITEVYGLNTFFVALTLYMTILWSRQTEEDRRIKYYYAICFMIGLALTNHPTFALMIPVLLIYVFISDKRFLLNMSRVAKGTGCILAGLLPYVYLPLASSRDPQMDWGNPETATNFFRVIMRHQYQLDETQSIKKFIPQLSAYGNMLLEQWWPFVLVFAAVALWALSRRNRNYLYLALIFLFFTGPLTTYLTNFDVTTGNPVVNAENKALVSVFYIPSYLMITLLIGVGLYQTTTQFLTQKKYILAAIPLILALPFVFSFSNYKKLDMSRYVFTEEYVYNLFSVVPQNGVVFVNWDPFIFPCNYYQYVEGERTDVTVVDQELLRRSWYIQSLRIHHAAFMSPAEKEVNAFLEAVRPFENKEKFDGNFIQAKYIAMINALINRAYDKGSDVFLTYDPPAGVAEKYFKESVIAAVKLRKDMNSLTPVDMEALQFNNYFDSTVPMDRMARFFKTYYGRLFFARGFVAEKLTLRDEALQLYQKAFEFLNDNPAFAREVNESLQRLAKQNSK